MFSFTSIGAKIHSLINDGSIPPQFILSGQNYHRIGSYCRKMGQLQSLHNYVFMTQKMNQLTKLITLGMYNSRYFFINIYCVYNSFICDFVILIYNIIYDKHNVLGQTFRRENFFIHDDDQSDFGLRLYRHRFKDRKVYNTPLANEIVTLILVISVTWM